MPRHRAQEFRKFLDEIKRNVPTDLDMHVVIDNASSHKTKLIRGWFAKRSRWHVHFTPTSSSWVNQVERNLIARHDSRNRWVILWRFCNRGHAGRESEMISRVPMARIISP